MSSQMENCREILNELFDERHGRNAWPFYKPVDAEFLGLPDYHEIIRNPMDLTTIKGKLENNAYATPEEFAADVRLIFQNCYTYNEPQHQVVRMARYLEEVFEASYQRLLGNN